LQWFAKYRKKNKKQSKSKRKRKTIKKAKEKAGVRGKFQFLVAKVKQLTRQGLVFGQNKKRGSK